MTFRIEKNIWRQEDGIIVCWELDQVSQYKVAALYKFWAAYSYAPFLDTPVKIDGSFQGES